MRRVFYLISLSLISFAGYSQTYNQIAKEYFIDGCEKVSRKNYKGDVNDFSEAIKRTPVFKQAYENRGVAKYYLHDFTGAIADFNIVIKSRSVGKNQRSKAFYYRGLSEIDLGQKESGCTDLNKTGKLGNKGAYEAIKKYCIN